jgi:2-polyprenyl-3-methyl-5-hydroxy-6-metoxy-1,4-benzoquinol methylase
VVFFQFLLKRVTVADVNPLYRLARKIYILDAGCMFGYPMQSNHSLTTFLEVSDLQEFRIELAKLSAQPIKSLKFSKFIITDMLK